MIKDIYGEEFEKNPRAQLAFQKLAELDFYSIGFQTFSTFVKKHQALLYPAFVMQVGLMKYIMGKKFWKKEMANRYKLSCGRYRHILDIIGKGNRDSTAYDRFSAVVARHPDRPNLSTKSSKNSSTKINNSTKNKNSAKNADSNKSYTRASKSTKGISSMKGGRAIKSLMRKSNNRDELVDEDHTENAGYRQRVAQSEKEILNKSLKLSHDDIRSKLRQKTVQKSAFDSEKDNSNDILENELFDRPIPSTDFSADVRSTIKGPGRSKNQKNEKQNDDF